MLNKLLLILFLSIGISASAHQPTSSTTMLVEKENNVWLLQISASLVAFQQEIRTHFAETPYQTPEEFQQMVLEHIKSNLDITLNESQAITLSHGIVKLGHETKVVFEVSGMPLDIHSLLVKNSIFKDIHKSKSALVILKAGFKKEHFVLSDENNHTLKLVVDQNKFVLETRNKASFLSFSVLMILIGVLALTLISKIIISKIYLNKK
jgi:hypothetical protein